jgi:hypothetical protein
MSAASARRRELIVFATSKTTAPLEFLVANAGTGVQEREKA